MSKGSTHDKGINYRLALRAVEKIEEGKPITKEEEREFLAFLQKGERSGCLARTIEESEE